MKNHKWDKSKKKPIECLRCGLIKYRRSTPLLMAITLDGKSHYKYEQSWEYLPKGGSPINYNPKCKC